MSILEQYKQTRKEVSVARGEYVLACGNFRTCPTKGFSNDLAKAGYKLTRAKRHARRIKESLKYKLDSHDGLLDLLKAIESRCKSEPGDQGEGHNPSYWHGRRAFAQLILCMVKQS